MVPEATRKAGPFTGNGVATSFAFDFKTFAKEDLSVIRTVVATGVESTLVLDSDYSVSLNADQDSDPGGTITYPLSGSPMASTHKLTVLSNMDIEQPTDITNQGGFYPQVIEDALDRAIMLIGQQQEEINRAVKVDASSTADPDDLIDDVQQAAADAAASATAAASSASAASTSATAAASSASAASTSATNAANSAAAAQAVVDSVGFRDVVFLTAASSPVTVTQGMSGKLLSIDTSGGAVIVNLPTISGITLPYTVGIKKATSDSNTVTINRGGSDTFDDGTTSKVISSVTGMTLIPDVDTSPDVWSVVGFNVAGITPVVNGGTGVATLTGIVKGNGTGAMTAATAGTDYAKPDTASAWTGAQRATPYSVGSVSGTVTLNMNNGNNQSLTPSGTMTLANPTNLTAGQSGSIFIDNSGGYAISYGSYWDFGGGTAPTAGTGVVRLDYVVRTTTSIHAQLSPVMS